VDLEEVSHGRAEHREIHEPRLTVEPEELEASSPCHQDAREDDEGLQDGFELEIENHEDDEKGERQHHFKLSFRPQMILIAPREAVCEATASVRMPPRMGPTQGSMTALKIRPVTKERT